MQLFERIVRTAVYALLAGFAGLVVWSFLAAFVKIATRVDIQSFPALAAAGLVGAGLVVARSVWTVRKNHVATVLAREEVELKEFNDHRQAENYLRGRALWFARSAVEDLDRMPDLLSSAAASYSRARETFADGAFSPFWSAIESSFRDLGQYLAAADRIGANARSERWPTLRGWATSQPWSSLRFQWSSMFGEWRLIIVN